MSCAVYSPVPVFEKPLIVLKPMFYCGSAHVYGPNKCGNRAPLAVFAVSEWMIIMSRKARIPELIDDRMKIIRRAGYLPKKRLRPICSKCNKPTYKVKVDHGRKNVKPKPGRPAKGAIRIRYEHIGHWCRNCEIFYYLDKTPDYRDRALQSD